MNNYKELWPRLKLSLKLYFKALLILSMLTFIILSIGLKVIGINMWGLKAFLIALVDLLPVLGSGTVMIPWAIFRAFSISLEAGAYIAGLYVLIVIIRFIAEPLIIGKNIGFSPIITFLITIISIFVFGPLGAILGGFITVFLKVLWDISSGKSAISSNKDHNKEEE